MRANPKDSEVWGRWARRILRKAIAPMRWRSGKSPRPGSAQQQQRQMEQSLKVNRYWLAIQQGDAALKAIILTGQNACSSRRVMSITPTLCSAGAGRCGDGAKRLSRRRRYYQQTLRMDSGNTNAVRGRRIYTASNRQKKLKRLSPRSCQSAAKH